MSKLSRGWLAGLTVLVLGLAGCGTPRNCLVIPAQIDLVRERRQAALKDLETKANQVDRTKNSIQHVQQRVQELQTEKDFLDRLPAGESQPGQTPQ
jgi:hypothetical protein